jgi:hypothetical protein
MALATTAFALRQLPKHQPHFAIGLCALGFIAYRRNRKQAASSNSKAASPIPATLSTPAPFSPKHVLRECIDVCDTAR